MIFDVMSERDAVAFSQVQDILPCVIISIRNAGLEDVTFAPNPNIYAVLHLKFQDTVEARADAICQADAEKIVAFAEAWKDKVESIVVHCTEGVSRSAGVCAGLMRYLDGDDADIFDSVAYSPNVRCYRYVLAVANRRRAAEGKPPIYGRCYCGSFWFKGDVEMLCRQALYQKGDAPDVQIDEEMLDYPHGSVEIADGQAIIRLSAELAVDYRLNLICQQFLLYPECGVHKVKIVTQGAA